MMNRTLLRVLTACAFVGGSALVHCGGTVDVVSSPALATVAGNDGGANSNTDATHANASWQFAQKVTRNVAEPNDDLGHSFAASNDTIFASSKARADDGSATNAIYIFERRENQWSWTKRFEFPREKIGALAVFGNRAMAALERVDINGTHASSRIVTFHRDATGWKQGGELADSPATSAAPCRMVMNGNHALLVGAGGIRIHEYGSDGYTKAYEADLSVFGCEAALAGDRAVVGTIPANETNSANWSAQLLERDSVQGWRVTQSVRLPPLERETGSYEPLHLALADDELLVSEGVNGPLGARKMRAVHRYAPQSDGAWAYLSDLTLPSSDQLHCGLACNVLAAGNILAIGEQDSNWWMFKRDRGSWSLGNPFATAGRSILDARIDGAVLTEAGLVVRKGGGIVAPPYGAEATTTGGSNYGSMLATNNRVTLITDNAGVHLYPATFSKAWHETALFSTPTATFDAQQRGLIGSALGPGRVVVVAYEGETQEQAASAQYGGVNFDDYDLNGTPLGTARVVPTGLPPWRRRALSFALDENTAVLTFQLYSYSVGATRNSFAVVFERTSGGWKQTALLEATDSEDSCASAGPPVALDGARVLFSGSCSSTLDLYARASDGTWKKESSLTPKSHTVATFLHPVLHGNRVVVGAYDRALEPYSQSDDEGSATYVFELKGGTWQESARLPASMSALFFDDGSLALGAGGYPNHVDIYRAQVNGTWLRTQTLSPTNAPSNPHFGAALASQGNTLLVGAPSDGEAAAVAGTGAVYIFRK